MYIWKSEIEKQYDNAEQAVDELFLRIKTAGPLEINGVKLVDREEQNSFALSVMDAIKNREILLIEAGVGIGKTYGYLIPIFETIKHVPTFNKIVISTSSIELQHQLQEVIKNKVEKILEIKVDVAIAKGIQNYACQKKIDSIISFSKDEKQKERMKEILRQMNKKQTADSFELENISKDVWKEIMLEHRGMCSNCPYSPICYYQEQMKKISQANIIIYNHASFAAQANEEATPIQEADAFVFDEAHKLEESIRSVNTKEIDLKEINACILEIKRDLGLKSIGGLPVKIKRLWKEIRDNIERIAKNNSRYEVTTENQELQFNYSKEVKHNLEIVISALNEFIATARSIIYDTKPKKKQERLRRKLKEPLETLENVTSLFEDMAKGITRNNIYWAKFITKNTITLEYTPKTVNETMHPVLRRRVPIIFTSGTQRDSRGSYNYFREGIGLNNGLTKSKIIEEYPLKSPYNFEENTLMYYNPNMPSPNFDKNLEAHFNSNEEQLKYISALTLEIDRLIRLTNGKALILFTSKKEMKLVYSILKEFEYPFNLFIQNENNTDKVKVEFTNDTDSCLFATGAFWEGVDIKGKSLSNLIICRLPFPTVGPIEQYKASMYAEENRFEQVYFNEMLTKFNQGSGRLIRDYNDTGIVCCLDSRIKTYLPKIKLNSPFSRYTTDMEELQKFVEQKILDTSPNKGSR